MENSAKGGGQDPSKSRPQEDALSESPFGATGVFGQANRSTSPDGFETEAARDVVPLDPWREQAPKAPLPPRPASLAEPVVHKVALGSGGGGNSQDLLQRIRNIREDRAVPEERRITAESAPSETPTERESAAPKGGSAGFTALLRTLGSDSPRSAERASETPTADFPAPAQGSGFTSLLRNLGSAGGPANQPEETLKRNRPEPSFYPEEPGKTVPAENPGSFTSLLRGTAGQSIDSNRPGQQPLGMRDAPLSAASGQTAPGGKESGPGEFTRLFGSFGTGSGSPSVSSAGGREAENAHFPNREAYAPPTLPQAQPAQTETPAEGFGLTRLIRKLDEPGKVPEPQGGGSSGPPQQPEGAGSLTAQYGPRIPQAGPSSPPTSVTAPAAVQGWAPPPERPQSAGGMNDPAFNAPSAAARTAGPSEFTRILDASRMRELGMKTGGAAEQARQPQASPPAPPPVAVPSYPLPVPPMPGGMGAMPQPFGMPGMQPPPMPGGMMSFGQGAGGSLGHMGVPAMQPPMYQPPPLPVVPPLPPPAQIQPGAGMGKLQQFVPLLLVLIIFLLVALLVTVIFLLKH